MRIPSLLLIAPLLLAAQAPRIGLIEFYGLKRVPETRVRKALGVAEGDPLPRSKSALEDKLESVPGIVRARVEGVCCESGKAVLYVGVEEKGAPHFEYRPEPTGDVPLNPAIVEAYHSFMAAFEAAARRGDTAESLREGHSLMRDPAARAAQEKFTALADANLENLRQVLRNSADPDQRATAAYVIGYVSKKRLVVDDLQYAMQDPDEGVRANAIRALGPIAALGRRDPELGIKVEPTWFIELLNSIVWSDRTRAAAALALLTEQRDPAILGQIRERALDSVVDMAQWRDLNHALPAFLLLGRIAGVPEDQIHRAWESGNRAASVLHFLQKLGIKR